MTFWDRVRAALNREKHDLDEVVGEANETMDRLEREQAASPSEKLEIERRRAEEADAAFEGLSRKIEGSTE